MLKKKWTDSILSFVQDKRNEGKSYNEIVPLLKSYFNLTATPIQLRKTMSDHGLIENVTKLNPKSIIVPKKDNILQTIEPIDWKIQKTKIKATKEKTFKTYLVTADYHVPHINKVAVNSILKLMEDIKFDGHIILGDYMDMEPISHWLENKKRTLENKRMLTDYVEGNKLLDELDKRLPINADKRYFYGNHERWYYDLIEQMPALEGLLDPKVELKLKERGYIVYDTINHIERIGRLSFVHGMYHIENYVKKHIDKFMTNVIHADLHSPRFRLAPSPAKEIAIVGYCIGCLCDMNPSYMKNKPHQWAHGFGVVYFYDNGFFDVDLKRIVKGKFVYNNKLYDGNV